MERSTPMPTISSASETLRAVSAKNKSLIAVTIRIWEFNVREVFGEIESHGARD